MKIILRYLLCLGAFALLPLLPSMARADNIVCPYPYVNYLDGPGTISVSNSVPVGSVIWSGIITFPTEPPQYCSGGGAPTWGTFGTHYRGSGNWLGTVGGTTNLYDTGIPGIAYRVYMSGTDLLAPGYLPVNGIYAGWQFASYTRTVGVDLVKIAPITGVGQISGAFADAYFTNQYDQETTHGETYVWRQPINVLPLNPTCTVATRSILVTLPDTSNAVPVGTTSNTVDFSLNLNCQQQSSPGTTTNVYLTLSDANQAGNTSNILTLTPGGATGWGIQVLWNNTPVGFGPDSTVIGTTNQWSVGSTTGANVTVPLKARYIKTLNSSTPGQANGLATFTFSYQ